MDFLITRYKLFPLNLDNPYNNNIFKYIINSGETIEEIFLMIELESGLESGSKFTGSIRDILESVSIHIDNKKIVKYSSKIYEIARIVENTPALYSNNSLIIIPIILPFRIPTGLLKSSEIMITTEIKKSYKIKSTWLDVSYSWKPHNLGAQSIVCTQWMDDNEILYDTANKVCKFRLNCFVLIGSFLIVKSSVELSEIKLFVNGSELGNTKPIIMYSTVFPKMYLGVDFPENTYYIPFHTKEFDGSINFSKTDSIRLEIIPCSKITTEGEYVDIFTKCNNFFNTRCNTGALSL